MLEVLKNPEAAGVSEELTAVCTPRLGDLLVAQGKVGRDRVEQALTEHPDQKAGVAIVKARAASVADVGQALRAQKQMCSGGQPVVDSSVRVTTERLDRLIDMVGELVIAQAMISQDETVANTSRQELSRRSRTREKSSASCRTSACPCAWCRIKAIVPEDGPPVARRCARSGKQVELAPEGEDTEIDRNMVE